VGEGVQHPISHPQLLEQASRYVTAQAEHHPDDAIEGWEGWSDGPVGFSRWAEPGLSPMGHATERPT